MPSPYEARLIRVLDYIHDNPAGDLSLDRLAEVAAMSRFHWHRVFHGMTGETCAQAVRRIRLHRAACWLVQSPDSLETIARRAGYDTAPSFTRAFKAGYGLTPHAFRKRGELRPHLAIPERGDLPMYPVDVAHAEDLRLAALPHKGLYLEISRTFEKVSAIFTSRNLWGAARGMAGVYYDDPNAVAAEDLRSHAGVRVAEAFAIPEDLEEVRVPAGRTAILHYKGPYSNLKPAYDYLFGAWLPDSGEEPRDAPCYEVYLNSPLDTAPEDLLTEICLPVR